jgi:hypothetical protein
MRTSIKILILLIMVFSLSFTVFAVANTDNSTTAKDVSIASGVPSAPPEVKKFLYDSKGKPDPMESPWLVKDTPRTDSGTSNEKPVQINISQVIREQLSGIIFAEDNPADSVAIFNGKFVKNGNVCKIPSLPKPIKISKLKREEISVAYDSKIYNIRLISKSN